MKTVIMAGGLGTRLKKITGDNSPKALAPIGGIPIIEHQIKLLAKYGLKDIVVSTGYLGEKIHSFCGNGSRWGVNISYSHEAVPIGIAGAIKKLEPKLKENFILLNGDLMVEMDLNRLISKHRKHRPLGTLVVHPNEHPYDSYLVEIDDQEYITNWIPKNNRSLAQYANLTNAGIHIFSPKIFSYILDDHKDLDKEVLPNAIALGQKILTYRTSEYIKDIGTDDRYHRSNENFKTGLISSRNLSKPQKAIFLDRDGTINIFTKGYVTNPNQMKLIPVSAKAISKINNSGYLAICVTNQPVIARNLCSFDMLKKIHNRMETLLGQAGAYLDSIYFCPHHPDKGYPEEIKELKITCDCRKPAIGMILKAKEKYNLDLNQSIMIGDTDRDISAAKNAGMKSILVRSGSPEKYTGPEPDLTCNDLVEAVDYILKQPPKNMRTRR